LVAFWSARAPLIAWAGFWVWFIAASAIGYRTGLQWHLLFGGIAASLFAAAWFWQRVAGVAMLAAAALTAWFFHNSSEYLLIAAPAALIGVLLLASRRAE
jgi:hypothetical protein